MKEKNMETSSTQDIEIPCKTGIMTVHQYVVKMEHFSNICITRDFLQRALQAHSLVRTHYGKPSKICSLDLEGKKKASQMCWRRQEQTTPKTKRSTAQGGRWCQRNGRNLISLQWLCSCELKSLSPKAVGFPVIHYPGYRTQHHVNSRTHARLIDEFEFLFFTYTR